MRLLILILILAQGVTAQSVLRVGSFTDPFTMDPHRTSHQGHFIYFAQLFESPLECLNDQDGRVAIRPGITDLPVISADGLTLTFKVRGLSRFADDPCFPGGKGRKVTAEDIAYSLMRQANPNFQSAYWPQFLQGFIKGLDAWRARCEKEKVVDYDLKGVEGLSVSDDTLTIGLTGRYPQLPALFTQTWASVVPREAVSRYGSAFGETRPVGSGPFRFDRKDVLGTVFMKRNPNYRLRGKGNPGVDELRIVHLTSFAQQTKRFLDGSLDITDVVPDNEKEFLTRAGKVKPIWRRRGYRLTMATSLEVSYLAFNCQNKFFGNPLIRQAVSLAINRPLRLGKLWGLRGTIANSPIPVGFKEAAALDEDPFRLRDQNVKRARELLAQAGHKNGAGLPEFIFDAPNSHKSEPAMVSIRGIISDLTAAGFRVQFRESDWPTFVARSGRGDFQLAWLSWFADYPDVENFLALFRSGATLDKHGFNYGSYSNAEFDKLYDELCTLMPCPRRSEIIKTMVQIVRKDAPWVFLVHGRQVYLSRKGVAGLNHHVLNMSLRDITVAPITEN